MTRFGGASGGASQLRFGRIALLVACVLAMIGVFQYWALSRSHAQLQQDLAAAQAQLTVIDEFRVKLHNCQSQCDLNTAELEGSLKQVLEKKKTLQEQLRTCEYDKTRIAASVDTEKENLAALKKETDLEISECRALVKTEKDEVIDMHYQLEALQTKHEKLQSTHKSLEGELEDQQKLTHEKHQQLSELKKTLDTLQDNFNSLTKKCEDRGAPAVSADSLISHSAKLHLSALDGQEHHPREFVRPPSAENQDTEEEARQQLLELNDAAHAHQLKPADGGAGDDGVDASDATELAKRMARGAPVDMEVNMGVLKSGPGANARLPSDGDAANTGADADEEALRLHVQVQPPKKPRQRGDDGEVAGAAFNGADDDDDDDPLAGFDANIHVHDAANDDKSASDRAPGAMPGVGNAAHNNAMPPQGDQQSEDEYLVVGKDVAEAGSDGGLDRRPAREGADAHGSEAGAGDWDEGEDGASDGERFIVHDPAADREEGNGLEESYYDADGDDAVVDRDEQQGDEQLGVADNNMDAADDAAEDDDYTDFNFDNIKKPEERDADAEEAAAAKANARQEDNLLLARGADEVMDRSDRERGNAAALSDAPPRRQQQQEQEEQENVAGADVDW